MRSFSARCDERLDNFQVVEGELSDPVVRVTVCIPDTGTDRGAYLRVRRCLEAIVTETGRELGDHQRDAARAKAQEDAQQREHRDRADWEAAREYRKELAKEAEREMLRDKIAEVARKRAREHDRELDREIVLSRAARDNERIREASYVAPEGGKWTPADQPTEKYRNARQREHLDFARRLGEARTDAERRRVTREHKQRLAKL